MKVRRTWMSPGLAGERLMDNTIGRLFIVCLMIAAIGLAGCKGETDNGTAEDSDSGDIVISLKDNPGDFVNYTVNVTSLTLTKANGAVVETVPLTTRVDFTQYTDMTEFLTVATIPAGVYTEAALTLDYQGAEIWVEDSNGNAIQVHTIQDEDGNTVSAMKVSVSLEGHSSLVIAPGIPAHITLDFDLNTSNSVEFDSGLPILTVSPVLQAEVNIKSPEIHRLRGPLKEVNTNEGTFEVIIHPFIHVLKGGDDRFGVLNVVTSSETIYEINGEKYVGQDGLEQLAQEPMYTTIIVVGDLTCNPFKFKASEVYAGSSVPGGQFDVVRGNVISRTGNVLTVKGATLIRSGGSVVFNDTVTVTIGEGTKVSRQLSEDDYTSNDISVGQLIWVFGTLTSESSTKLEMDATDGHVRMMLSTLRGTIVEIATGKVIIDLSSIDGRHVGIYDFKGTGLDVAHDADPNNYEIDCGSLNISSLAVNAPVKIKGFVMPFGQAPDDFQAQTIVNVSNVIAVMNVAWFPASAAALNDISSEGFTINLTGTGLFHHVGRSGVIIDLKTLNKIPSIKPEQASGVFSIIQRGSIQVHTTFEDFISDLQNRLSQGGVVRRIIATGSFNDDTGTMTSSKILVQIQ